MSKPKQKTVTPILRFPEFRDAGPWAIKKIDDYFDVRSSKRVLQKDWQEEGVPFYRTRELVSLSKNEPFSSEVYISEELFSELANKYGLPVEGDFLVSGVGTLGIVYQVKAGDRFYFKDGNVLWMRRKSNINSTFFLYSFGTPFVQKQIKGGASISTVGTYTIEKARKTNFACPPTKEEQQKIADCLSSLDDLIRAEEAQLAALKEHKKGLMQQLFPGPGETTPRLRFPEFRDVGPWEVKRLEDGIKLVSGQHLGPKQYTSSHSDYPYFTGPSDFTDDESAITKWVAKKVSPQLAREGDVLVTVKGSGVGELWHLTLPKVAIGRQLMAVRGTKFHSRFLFYFLDGKRTHLAALAAGNMIPGLSRDDLLSLPLAAPSLREQQNIADCLSLLDDLIQAKAERIETLKTHKRGLMQQLFPSLDGAYG